MKGNFQLAPEQWATLRRLLDQALDLPAPEREAWLDTLAPEFHEFKPRLRALLGNATETTVGRLLETLPRVETGQFAPRPGAAARDAADSVGPYRLLREIGSGGMASVWLAERTDMLQGRQVALKLPHGAWRRAGLAERLAREREILATLEHPNIARLYDAGVAADGQPYLALEYVEGERIDAYCERKALGVAERVRLVVKAARAVAHAHAQLVVHRDLKPSNLLVTSGGEVKLLDFGIAKLLDQGVANETALTRAAGRALTPEYAAPEQILGRPIGTATDVYALGVLLFELLAGQRPYVVRRDSVAALEEAIVRADVPRPSSVAPSARRTALRGDLDTIVLRALKKEPAQRYATADALADDLARYLERRPVMAQPDSGWYRLRKFVLRNRLGVGAAAAVMVAVLAGSGVAISQARVAVAERKRADEVKDFIAGLFRDANPYLGGGRKMTVDELLLKAKPKIDAQFEKRPDIRAELLLVVGTNLGALGENQAAAPILREADALASASLGADHRIALHARALVLNERYYTDPGPELARESDALLAAMRRNEEVDPAYFVMSLGARAQLEMREGRPAAAVPFAEEAQRVSRARIGEQAEQTLGMAIVLTLAHQRSGQWREALAAAEQAMHLAFAVRKFENAHPLAVDVRLLHGMVLADAGRIAEGLQELEQGVAHSLERRAPTDADIGSFRGHLARYQVRAGQIDRALRNAEEALAILRAAVGEKNRRFAQAALDLGGVLLAARRPERALQPLREAHGYFGVAADVSAPLAAARLAAALTALDRRRQGEAALAAVGDRGWEVLHRRGQIARESGRFEDAAALQRQALAALTDAPADVVARAEAMLELGQALLGAERFDEASRSFEQAIELLRPAQLRASPTLADALLGTGVARLRGSRPEEALAPLQESAALWLDFDATHRSAGESAYWLGRCYAALGRDADAKEAFARAARILANSPLPGDARLLQLARAG